MIQEKWNLRRRGTRCAITEEAFADQQIIVTALFEDPESNDLLRRDYSEEGWAERPSQDRPFSSWRSEFKADPPKEEAVQVVPHDPESLLRALIEQDDPLTENARYILAVMLERKKLLRPQDEQNLGETRLLIYEHAKSGEVFMVADPRIPLSQVDQVQSEVTELLENPERLFPEPRTPNPEN
ncbi:MAG: hypothetical protein AAF555_07490 [Verrucomicrobiota bacterium]